MSMIGFGESKMFFEWDADDLYRIEKTALVGGMTGVKICEFVSNWKNGRLLVVEAKQSSPKLGSEDFDKYESDITAKIQNTILLLNAVLLKRHDKKFWDEMPENIRKCNLSTVTYKIFLIIKGHKDDWLSPITDELRKKMSPFFQCWNIKDISLNVINEGMAKEKGIIVSFSE